MKSQFRKKICYILGFTILIWVIELINQTTGHRFLSLGIYPRRINGLYGVILSPLLHNGIIHIAMNTIPLIVLSSLVIMRGISQFLRTTLFITIVGGLLVWVLGRSSYHVGASGLIFGYFGYLIARGWFEKSFTSVLLTAITIFLYGGIIWGVLPMVPGVSWEGHLFGMIAGFIAAKKKNSI